MIDKLEMTRLRMALTALALSGAGALIVAASAHADRIDNGVAVFSALDKVTARTSKFEVPLNSTTQFGQLKVTPRVCYSRPPEEQPKTTSFVEVDEIQLDGQEKRIFTGWMFAESPGLNAVEHPVFDVWLTDCQKPKGPSRSTLPTIQTQRQAMRRPPEEDPSRRAAACAAKKSTGHSRRWSRRFSHKFSEHRDCCASSRAHPVMRSVEPDARREYFRSRDNEKNAQRRLQMFPRIILTLGLLVGASAVLSQSAVAEVAVDAALMKVLDPDADGTVDLAEAKAAGAAVFKKLDPDNDGTLDAKELSGRLDEAGLKAADPDNDGTLDMTSRTR